MIIRLQGVARFAVFALLALIFAQSGPPTAALAGHGLIQYHPYSSPYEGLRLKQ